ncbi:MAG: DUF6600 domain-containing protein [bacterium]
MKRLLSVLTLTGLALILVALAAGMVHAAEKMRFARVSESEGDAWVLRAGMDEWEPCGVNTPLGESDIVETEDDSYAEVQLDDGTVISLSEETRLDFKSLRFNDKGSEVSVLCLPYGSIRMMVARFADLAEYLTVDLPSGRVHVDENTSLRINVKGSKASEVLVYRGEAILEGVDGEVAVRGGRQGYLDSDGYLGPVRELHESRDYFDLWCSERYDKYREPESTAYLDDDVYHAGAYDLDYHGTWVYVSDYGYCWRPRVRLGWYPYSSGHWVWSVHWGWTWVSYEPWGWIPYHYGRWTYTWRWGWVWVPGSVWGPAWVVWIYYDDCVGWAPLCPYDYPCDCYYFWCRGPWTYVYRYSFYHPYMVYRYRAKGKYRYYKWGEKRYRYRDGKGYRTEEYRTAGPQAPKWALKKAGPSVAEGLSMKTGKKAMRKVGIESSKGMAHVAGSSRELPQKPRTVEVSGERSRGLNETEKTHVTRRNSGKLPQKPNVHGTKKEDRAERNSSGRSERASSSKARSHDIKRPTQNTERLRAPESEEERATPARRVETRQTEYSREKRGVSRYRVEPPRTQGRPERAAPKTQKKSRGF